MSPHEKSLTTNKKPITFSRPNPAHLSPELPVDRQVFSSRAQLLHVAANLTTEDVSKLAYLFADRIPCALVEQKADAVNLLWQLEAVGALHPDHPKMFINVLNVIGRRDLASALLSVQTPQLIQSSLGTPHQLLHMKMSMFADKQSLYSRQRKLLSTIVGSDKTVFEEQIVKPVLQNLHVLHNSPSLCWSQVSSRQGVSMGYFLPLFPSCSSLQSHT